MSTLRVAANSDILAATGKGGMQAGEDSRFWNWRRVVLTIGYLFVFLTGLPILIAADPNGLILMLAAVAGFLFLHRIWLGVAVWVYVLASGIVAICAGDDLGLYGVTAGVAFGIVALPIWSRWAKPRPIHGWQQSPFQMPPPIASPVVVEPSADPTPAQSSLSAPTKPMIRTIGRIQVLTASGDLTSDLLRKPVTGFIWLYLLAREVRKPGDQLTRTAITDEVAPRVNDPRGRLRGYLHDLSHLPEPTGQMVRVEDELIGFDLGGVDADFVQLRDLVKRVRETNGSLDDELLHKGQTFLLELGDGEFLPGFEDMEKRVTKGRGSAGQIVAEVRVQIDTMRADLAVAVGEALLDRGQASLAAAVLEPIVKRAEDRDDVARTLSTALRELGQHGRAAEIRRRNVAGQES
jgi:hypothetical protein